jgi:hypothetical protein
MASTTNYNWSTPDDTALVKDGAAAIRTLGSSIDTTTKALNPSTTLGDIEYRSATANTNTRLGIGTTGQVLTVAGGVPTWASAGGGGKVLQVVMATSSAASTVATTTLTDQGLSGTITPTASTSKVLVLVSTMNQFYRLTNIQGYKLALLRGSTTVWSGDNVAYGQFAGSTSVATHTVPITYLDSPSTTSATTYKIQIAPLQTSSTGQVFCNELGTSTMILLEIGA